MSSSTSKSPSALPSKDLGQAPQDVGQGEREDRSQPLTNSNLTNTPTAAQNPESASNQNQFGVSNRLLSQYMTVGTELLAYERACNSYRGTEQTARLAFRQGVSFIPVEVLESYLDDLLDLEVHDRKLYIERKSGSLSVLVLALMGITGALTAGLHAASEGTELFSAIILTMSLAFPFGLLWHYSPRRTAIRRMILAQVVSGEAARRRGHDKDGRGLITHKFSIAELLGRRAANTAHGTAFRNTTFRNTLTIIH